MNHNTFVHSFPLHQEQSATFSFAKRALDIICSLLALILLSPFFFLIWISIRLSSKGPAIFCQHRLGKNGKVFKCLKFRTMIIDAEKTLPVLLSQHPGLLKEWNTHQKLRQDPRVFPIGKFLRRTSLDELPQFWNILKGELSLVGPRPYLVCQQEEMGLWAEKILSIRPGLTGLWQTSGRSRTTFRERILLDCEYVKKQSLLLDFLLIFKTFSVLLSSEDAC